MLCYPNVAYRKLYLQTFQLVILFPLPPLFLGYFLCREHSHHNWDTQGRFVGLEEILGRILRMLHFLSLCEIT